MKKVPLPAPSPAGQGAFELPRAVPVFFDEIGDSRFPMQVKLLRVLARADLPSALASKQGANG